MLISVEGTGKNQLQPGRVVTLFFAKKLFITTDQYAGALS